MNEFIGGFISEYFQLIIFISGVIWAASRYRAQAIAFKNATEREFHTRKCELDNELTHIREYVDLKTNHINDQIDDIKKSIDGMSLLVNNLCKRLDKIIDCKI